KVDVVGSVGLSVFVIHGPGLRVRCQFLATRRSSDLSMSPLRRTAAGGVLRLKVDMLGSVGLSVIGSHGPVLSVRCQMRESLPMVMRRMSALTRATERWGLPFSGGMMGAVGLSGIGSH